VATPSWSTAAWSRAISRRVCSGIRSVPKSPLRKFFSPALFVAAYLLFLASGRWPAGGGACGLAWRDFRPVMGDDVLGLHLALTLTTTANTLVVLSVGPLVAAAACAPRASARGIPLRTGRRSLRRWSASPAMFARERRRPWWQSPVGDADPLLPCPRRRGHQPGHAERTRKRVDFIPARFFSAGYCPLWHAAACAGRAGRHAWT